MGNQQGSNLPYSTRNSIQCYVALWMEGEFGKEWIHVHKRQSLLAVHPKLSQHCVRGAFHVAQY